MVAEQKRRQPKRRKKYANLDDAWIDENRKTLLVKYARVAELQTQITDRTEAREQQLLSLVDAVHFEVLSNDMIKHDSRCTSSFRSQGYRADAYAKGALCPEESKLSALGFSAEIRYRKTMDLPWHRYQSRSELGDYELWSNASPWQFDAVRRLITLGEAIEAIKSRGLSARVYYPMLHPSIDVFA